MGIAPEIELVDNDSVVAIGPAPQDSPGGDVVTDVNHWKVPRASGVDIWGYGRYGDDQLLPLSFDDVQRDTAAAAAALSALGLPDRSVVVLTSTVADIGHFHPLQGAAKEMGFLVCNADASAMDADRVEMFIRLLRVAAVIGVNDSVVNGLLERGHDLRSFFSRRPVGDRRSGAARDRDCGRRGGRIAIRAPGSGPGVLVPIPKSALRRTPMGIAAEVAHFMYRAGCGGALPFRAVRHPHRRDRLL